uniref:BZIP domain-containing protein n=1 Tax=Trichuris muris TaxID=70415 RepID=A0A5S6QDM4_TRIMR
MDFHLGQEMLFSDIPLKDELLTSIGQQAFVHVNQPKLPSLADEKLYVVNGGHIWSSKSKTVQAGVVKQETVQEINDNGDTSDYRKAQFNRKTGYDDQLYDEHSYALPPYLQKMGNTGSSMHMTDDSADRFGASTDGDESERDAIGDCPVDLRMKEDRLLPGGSHRRQFDCTLRSKQLSQSIAAHNKSCTILPLTEEENRMCEKEGIKMPLKFPLSKTEERIVKRVRRKIRNKRSAQESRKRKQAYVEALEKKVKSCTMETQTLQNRVKVILTKNRDLEQEVARMKMLLDDSEKNQSTSAYVTVFILSVAMIFSRMQASMNEATAAVPTSDCIATEMQTNDQCPFGLFESMGCERVAAVAALEDNIDGGVFQLNSVAVNDDFVLPAAELEFSDFLGQSFSSETALFSFNTDELSFGQPNFPEESKVNISELTCQEELLNNNFGYNGGIGSTLGNDLNASWCTSLPTSFFED